MYFNDEAVVSHPIESFIDIQENVCGVFVIFHVDNDIFYKIYQILGGRMVVSVSQLL